MVAEAEISADGDVLACKGLFHETIKKRQRLLDWKNCSLQDFSKCMQLYFWNLVSFVGSLYGQESCTSEPDRILAYLRVLYGMLFREAMLDSAPSTMLEEEFLKYCTMLLSPPASTESLQFSEEFTKIFEAVARAMYWALEDRSFSCLDHSKCSNRRITRLESAYN